MAASNSNLAVKSGGVWRYPTSVSVKTSGVWRDCKEVWVKSGGVWRHSWVKSDPQTYTYNAEDTDSYRPSSWRTDSNILYQGSWDYGDHIGAAALDYYSIANNLSVRPNVTDVQIYLYRRDGSGYGNSTVSYAYVWALAAGEVDVTFSLTRTGQPDLVDGSKQAGEEFDRADGHWFNISSTFLTDYFVPDLARGFAVAISETLSSTGGQDIDYMIFDGYLDTNNPKLKFTCDYAGT